VQESPPAHNKYSSICSKEYKMDTKVLSKRLLCSPITRWVCHETRTMVILNSSLERSCFILALPDSASEKPARGSLFTAMQRQLATDTILIIDSMNYIKGFRYQMYCAARELKLRTCTVRKPSNLLAFRQPRSRYMLLRARTYVENGMTMPIPKRRKSFTFLVSAHVLSRLQSRQSDNEV